MWASVWDLCPASSLSCGTCCEFMWVWSFAVKFCDLFLPAMTVSGGHHKHTLKDVLTFNTWILSPLRRWLLSLGQHGSSPSLPLLRWRREMF